MLGGGAATYLLALPTYPQDPVGFEELGWVLLVLVVGSVVALLAGTAALHRSLRGEQHRGRTVLLFVPLAVLLGSVTASVGALAAAPLARVLAVQWGERVSRG